MTIPPLGQGRGPRQRPRPARVRRCRQLVRPDYEWTDNDFLARSADTIVDKTVTIAVIVVVALIVRRAAAQADHTGRPGNTRRAKLHRMLHRAPRRNEAGGHAAGVGAARPTGPDDQFGLRSIASWSCW